jgi:8-oxo-dGTP pyrophosphatase MutT (NUDIX family)
MMRSALPLENSPSEKAFVHNLKIELGAGKPRGQALAVAYAKKREASDKAPLAAGVLYRIGDQILMMRRAPGKTEGGTWGFPAGGIEAGETPEQAAYREFYEETGLDLGGRGLTHYADLDGFVLFSVDGEKFDPRLNDEHTGFVWAKVGDLPKPLHPGVVRVLERSGMDRDTARRFDDNGWFEIKRNPLSKTGVFPYLGKNIDPSLEPEKTYMVYRPASELSNPETIESFKLLPWVDLHPDNLLGPEDAGRLPAESKGVEGVIGEDVFFEGDTLYGNIKIFSDSLADKTDSGVRELSLGYSCEYEISSGVFNGINYDAVQKNIRGNHLATVPEGRMGPDVAVLDHLRFTFDARDIQMAETKETTGETTLDDVNEFMKEHMPKIKAMVDLYEKHTSKGEDMAEMPATEPETQAVTARDKDETPKEKAEDAEEPEKEKKGNDESEEEKKDDKEAKDGEEEKKEGKDEEEKEKKRDASDAKQRRALDTAITRVGALESQLESIKKNGVKSLMQEISRRTELANKISSFTGAFDHSEMTVGEVASYGVRKLGLKAPAGQEMVALDAYFVNRAPQSEQISFALDRQAAADAGVGAVEDFYSQSAA